MATPVGLGAHLLLQRSGRLWRLMQVAPESRRMTHRTPLGQTAWPCVRSSCQARRIRGGILVEREASSALAVGPKPIAASFAAAAARGWNSTSPRDNDIRVTPVELAREVN